MGAPLLLLVGLLAGQANTSAELDRAEALIGDLEFQAARAALMSVLARTERIDERLRAYGLLAFARSAHQDPRGASQAFLEALELDPSYRPAPGLSPKVVAAFEAARRALAEHPVAVASVGTEWQPRALRVTGVLSDGLVRVTDVIVRTAPADGEPSAARVMPRGEGPRRGFEARIPFARAPAGLSVSIAARAASGATLAEHGPVLVSAPPPTVQAGTSWYQRWWVWVAVGVTVASATTAGVLLARDDRVVIDI